MELKNKTNEQNKTVDAENRLVVARGEKGCRVGKMGKRGQEVQISSHKINKSWGWNGQHGDYSNNTIRHIWKLL